MSGRSILVRGSGAARGLTLDLKPEDAGWEYIGFSLLRLPEGDVWEGNTGAREAALVPIGGVARVSAASQGWDVGGRDSPFDGPPHCLYLPAGIAYRVEARTALELAICNAPTAGDFPARLYTPDQTPVHIRGEGQCRREIRDILLADGQAGSLLLTEVCSPAGNWSSYPPHKHDEDRMPGESPLEETYYFKIRPIHPSGESSDLHPPRRGFALQRVYTADGSLDQTVAPRDGDLVLVPRGYHVVGAPHAYEVYYLNVLAGPRRTLRVTFDPDHVWIKESWGRAW